MKHRILIGTVVTVAMATPALAQSDEAQMRAKKLALEAEMQHVMTMRAESVVESRIIAGQPYAAEATTEFVQVLGDGNRISRKNTVRIYRDGEGRTRREELGAGDVVKSISIYDPVAHLSYVLDPDTRTARKSAVRIVHPEGFTVTFEGGEHALALKKHAELAEMAGKIALVGPETVTVSGPVEVSDAEKAERADKVKVERAARAAHVGGGVGFALKGNDLEKTSTESLGRQMIGGVTADGIRTTTVLPAGAIGNEQEIRIVSEEWRSPDLQVLVMTRHSDPRSGETTYRLSNIVRGEPGAGLFEVPADYTIRESSYMKMPSLQ